ncbi:MAG TPA: hypothetical protein VI977_05465 [archaeon]|nr:hypothetical protein [archaeon]
MFVTTPAFQEWIQGNSEWIGKNLGSVELRIHEKEKKIKFMWFYPFGEDKISVKGESKHPDEIFGRKGIGAFAFFRVLKETKELFPSFKISFGTSPTTIMRKMLVPMGWKRPYRYKISTATKRTRDYVARKMRDRRRK